MRMRKIALACLPVLVVMMAACNGIVVPPSVAPPEPSLPAPTLAPAPTTVTPAPTQETPSEKTSAAVVPSYAASIELRDAAGDLYGRGNTCLVDRDKRLFSTNAHIVAEFLDGLASSMWIQIGGVWYPADVKEEWVNWRADTAIVRIRDSEGLLLPASARLGKAPAEGSDVRVVGYLSLAPYATDGLVIARDLGWVTTPEALADRALLIDEFLMSMPEGAETFEIPKFLRPQYYKHYILVKQKQLNYDMRFRAGVSGMCVVVVGEGEEVVATISAYVDLGYGIGGFQAFAVPAEEITELLKKVNGLLK